MHIPPTIQYWLSLSLPIRSIQLIVQDPMCAVPLHAIDELIQAQLRSSLEI